MHGRTALLALAMLTFASESVAQEIDDWDLFVDEQVSVASLSYEGGHSLLVQCSGGRLEVAIDGWAIQDRLATFGGTQWLSAEVLASDGRADRHTWTQRGAMLAEAWPARSARFFRGGGAVTLTLADGSGPGLQLDMPATSTNLDRVLSDCDTPLEDERDRLENISHLLTRMPRTRPTGARDPGEAEVTCIVGADLRLRDCRVESVTPRRSQLRRTADRALEGAQIEVSDRDAAIGGVLYYRVTGFVIR